MTEVFQNQFGNWADIQRDFAMNEPEPDEVLLAKYEYENYEGSAEVYFRRGDKFYIAAGSHCSCYGLEGQWDPEEYASRELFIECLRKGVQSTAEYDYGNRSYAQVLQRLGESYPG